MNRLSLTATVFLFGAGIALTQAGLRRIDVGAQVINPFAIRQSGYGMMMARLSQDTVNRIWHSGVEGSDHDHSKCTNPAHHHELDHDVKHHHDGKEGAFFSRVVEDIREHLESMSNAENRRTSKYAMTEQHRLNAARRIEHTLLRSYQMDPTNYGVYNAYYLFLTMNDYGATEADKRKAEKLSRFTIGSAYHETENPAAWLTAASASLNLFFSEQGRRKKSGEEFTANELKKYRNQLSVCLTNYSKIVSKRKETGTWSMIPAARKEEMRERERFAGKTYEQFDAMLNRLAANEGHSESKPASDLVTNTEKNE